jgi:hypothetical protein
MGNALCKVPKKQQGLLESKGGGVMRLIDADRIIYQWTVGVDGKFHDGVTLQSIINEMPTVEAKPIVRSEWKSGKNHGEFVEVECTACEGLLLVKWYDEIDRYRFCPNCGARMENGADMRGEKND